MKITEDVHKYAAELGLTNEAAMESGMRKKGKNLLKAAPKYAKARHTNLSIRN
jgi:hypothetical protein